MAPMVEINRKVILLQLMVIILIAPPKNPVYHQTYTLAAIPLRRKPQRHRIEQSQWEFMRQ